MLKLNSISYSDNGCKINYNYETINGVSKYFRPSNKFYSKYEIDVSQIPKSIAVIPFISNTITIAWFAGFKIEVDELDEDFFNSLVKIKKIFSKWYPHLKQQNSLVVNKLIKNRQERKGTAMLFSGGVDAFATYIRHIESSPDLITIHGPDIEISDLKQWNDLKLFMANEPVLSNNKKNYVESNVRDFYTYKVQLLIDDLGWWGKIQHGISLLGLTAPLSWVNHYDIILIASSYTKNIDISWGSTPETDEALTWGGIRIVHDGYDLLRQDKVDLIADFCREKLKKLKLRVCYSELRDEFNCSKCEKCFRTILGLILAGQDPNKFGFSVSESFYNDLFNQIGNGNSTKGMNYFWWELMEKAKKTEKPFIFRNKDHEMSHIQQIASGQISNKLEDKLIVNNVSKKRLKFILRNKFAPIYNAYKKIRYNLR